MMSSPRVSVILPCFNAAATVRRAIESITAQTFQQWELIAFNDGSTDATGEILHELSAIDRRIRVIKSSHVGIVEALTAACTQATGTYLARMDADDVSRATRLARQVELMDNVNNLALCGTCVRMVGPAIGYGRRRYERWINRLISHDDIVRELFVECPIPHPTFMLRRETFERIGGYQDHGWAEDYDLCMRLFRAGARFAKVSEPLLDWTESATRHSMTSERYSPQQFRRLKRHYLFKSFLRERPTFHQWGAGEVGKLWLREWEGRQPTAVVDINPNKIGHAIHKTPVIAPDELPPPGDTFTVIAVGAPNARQEIRQWLLPRGYRECVDFIFLA